MGASISHTFDRLAAALSGLPGVGRRSAERMAIKLAVRRDSLMRELRAALDEADSQLRCCSLCSGLTTADEDPCRICADSSRDQSVLCVVEDPGDILTIERTGAFKGLYHALMGKLSPMAGTGPDAIRMQALAERVRGGGVSEVLLALNSDMESDATASYIRELLAGTGVRISRLAFGLPVGSAVTYADPVTLGRAIEGRRPVG